jgi:hypothetical protein
MWRARAYTTVAQGSVGAYTRVGTYGSFKKLPSEANGMITILKKWQLS